MRDDHSTDLSQTLLSTYLVFFLGTYHYVPIHNERFVLDIIIQNALLIRIRVVRSIRGERGRHLLPRLAHKVAER